MPNSSESLVALRLTSASNGIGVIQLARSTFSSMLSSQSSSKPFQTSTPFGERDESLSSQSRNQRNPSWSSSRSGTNGLVNVDKTSMPSINPSPSVSASNGSVPISRYSSRSSKPSSSASVPLKLSSMSPSQLLSTPSNNSWAFGAILALVSLQSSNQ